MIDAAQYISSINNNNDDDSNNDILYYNYITLSQSALEAVGWW